MTKSNPLNLGLAGAAGRGKSFREGILASGLARIHAVCDIDPNRLDQAMADMGASEKYIEYADMIEKSDIDAVIIATPMPFHVPQSIMALERGIHVMSEVPAGVSIEECRRLVETCKNSSCIYMMGENCNYMKPMVLIGELVKAGLFGEVYYAEGEYLHELKELNEMTKWRRKWQTGVNGITYGTHCLGPVLSWMPGDRVCRVSCSGSGHHYVDRQGMPYEQEDTTIMTARTIMGRLIRIRVDMLSSRPMSSRYSLQGTDGCYETGQGVWLKELSPDNQSWLNLQSLEEKYLPDSYKNLHPEILNQSHDGSDFLEIMDFIKAIQSGIQSPIGIHEAMDMTLPGLVSQMSIQQDGKWLEVPDSRDWSSSVTRQPSVHV
jgi:predicted dehydrogenase